jgi:DNA-binding response OmpR family regulator
MLSNSEPGCGLLRNSMRILYVENSARFAQIVTRRYLTEHEVNVVPGLAAARAALAQSSFEAILLDYDLDDGKGDALVFDLQNLAPRPFVVAASSHQGGNDALMAAGADVVCGKMQFSNIEAVLAALPKPRV